MIYLLHGENSFESFEECKKIKKEFLNNNKKGEILTYNPEEIAANKFDLDNYGFLTTKKMHVLNRFFEFKKPI